MPGERFPVLGILGGGQLGRMTALAAIPMGIGVRFLVPEPAPPVAPLGEVVVGDWNDPDIVAGFAAQCDAITVESEWAPAEVAEPFMIPPRGVFPSPNTLLTIRNKATQKAALKAAGLPLPPYALCTSLEDARESAQQLAFPVVLKKPLGSYDGYGNVTVRSDDELVEGWGKLQGDAGVIVEGFVEFQRELSVIVARRPQGDHVTYPLAFTEQRDHRCHAVVVPAGVTSDVEARALEVALAAVEAVDSVGITAVELFETTDGGVLINELAPRPHNTGHYSIEACHTSQFENHVRAVLDLPLGDPSLRVGAACMVNVIGGRAGATRTGGFSEALSIPGVAVHLYGKPETRPGRKMGHVTATGIDPAEVRARAEHAAGLIQL